MSAIGLTLFIYLALAYWLSRIATPEELLTNTTIMVDKAVWGWAIVLVLALYVYLSRRQLASLDSDVRSGLFSPVAEWGVKRARLMQAAPERTWKPVVLATVRSVDTLSGSYLFLRAMTSPKGTVQALGICPPGEKEQLEGLQLLTKAFRDDGIYAVATLLEETDFVNGVRVTTQVLQRTFFRPNILFLHLREDSDPDELQQLVDKTAAYQMGIAMLARHPVVVLVASFKEALAQTPCADLSIFGLSKEPDLTFVQNLTKWVNGSCVFVRDSGDESALA